MEKKSSKEVLHQLTEAVEYEGSQLSFLFIAQLQIPQRNQQRSVVKS